MTGSSWKSIVHLDFQAVWVNIDTCAPVKSHSNGGNECMKEVLNEIENEVGAF